MAEREKIAFIVSAAAADKVPDGIQSRVAAVLDGTRYDARFEYTARPGHAYELAVGAAIDGCGVLVAVGGDGTVNEVGRACLERGAVLGIVPLGSGNGLARHLGIPLELEGSVAVLNDPRVSAIDYGTANDVVFFCTCGVGFDARVGYAYARTERHGFFSYLKSIVTEFFRYKSKKYKFTTADGRVFKRKAFLVAFANAGQYGYDAYISPDADIRDGKIDVCILEPFPAHRVPELLLRLLGRRIHESRFVQILRAEEVTVKRKKKDLFVYDGESCRMKRKIRIRTHRGGLRVLVRMERSE